MPQGQAAWTLHCDGGCAPSNPGPAGWGVVLHGPAGQVSHHWGFLGPGTNQIAELNAAIAGLELTPAGAVVALVSDSQYVVKGLTEWRSGWERKGFRNSKGEPVANMALWKRLFALADERAVQARWVRGHAGHEHNEVADRLVAEALRTRASGSRCV